ncbi:MAG: hypothetical protein ACM3NI_06040 [Bacteroidota bacterium]
MNFKRLLLTLPLLFSACHNRDETDENSPYFVIPVGSRLVLHQAVTVPAFAAAAYLQGGLWMPQTEISRYNPHCKFELRQPKDAPQTVAPDEFVITRTTEEVEVQSETTQIRSRVLMLQSERQPQVSRLSCTVWQTLVEGRPVNGRELRQALGRAFTLEIAGRAASSPQHP